MSRPNDPTRPDTPGSVNSVHHELRRRGRLLGMEYDIGIRLTELLDPAMEPSRAPLVPGTRRLALPGAPEIAEAPAPEGIGRWESDGGK